MVESPCINKCFLKDGYCLGCNRSIRDISQWKKMTDEEKLKVLKNIESKKRTTFEVS